MVAGYKSCYVKSRWTQGVNNILFLEKSLHIPWTYLWFSEQVTSLLAWTAAGRITLSKNKVLRTTLDPLAVSSPIAYEALWWPLLTAFAWVKWIIYLGFCMAVTCKCSYPEHQLTLAAIGIKFYNDKFETSVICSHILKRLFPCIFNSFFCFISSIQFSYSFLFMYHSVIHFLFYFIISFY